MKELILAYNINKIDDIIKDYYEYEEIIVYRIGSKPMEESISYCDKIIELIGNDDVYIIKFFMMILFLSISYTKV